MVFNIKFSQKSNGQKKWEYPGSLDKTTHNIYHYLQMRECGLLSKNIKNYCSSCSKKGKVKNQKSGIFGFFDKSNSSKNQDTSDKKKNYYFYPHETYNENEFKHSIYNIVSNNIPGTFTEYELPLSGNDKIFASKWLSDQYIIFGTKNSKLILYHTKTGLQAEIPCQPKELLNHRDLNNVINQVINISNHCHSTTISSNNFFSTQTNFGYNTTRNYNYTSPIATNTPIYSPSSNINPFSPFSPGPSTASSDISMSSITVVSTSTMSNSFRSPISPLSNYSSDTYVNEPSTIINHPNNQNDSLVIENEIIFAENINNNNVENHSIVSNSDDPSSNQYLTSETTTTSSSNLTSHNLNINTNNNINNINNNVNIINNNVNNVNKVNNNQYSTLDNYVNRYPYYDDEEDDNFFNKSNYLYKPQIHLEKQQIGQLEQLQSQIQPEYKEKIQQLQQQQEKLVISTNNELLSAPKINNTQKKSPKVPKIIIPKAQPETKLLNDYADVMDIVSLIPTILGENIDIPPDQSPIRQHFVAPSPTSKSVPITPLSEQINVTSKRHNEYIKKKEVNSLKRRSSLKYESYHAFDDSTTDGSPAIVYSNPDTSCSFKRNSTGSNKGSRLSINTDVQPKQITKAKSPLGLNAPMLPPMMIDSTTAAMLETHGNSLLLQQDPSMSSTNQTNNNLMSMSFTEGVTNNMNLPEVVVSAGNVTSVGSSEIPNGKLANPLPRKAYRRRTLVNENQEPNGLDAKEKERRHRSRRHSHHHKSMHTKDMTPEELEKLAEERRERRHSRRPDETESERRERHERRKSRRPLTIIDENGVEKVVHRHRRHHHRSSRYVAEDGTLLPEKPRSSSSHRHSRHRQSVAVGEQQQHSHHSHDYLRSKHQSLAPNKANQSSIESTSFNLDTRSLNDISNQNNPPNNPSNNSQNNPQNISIPNSTNIMNNTNLINTNSTNLPTQEINDFFDNIFKLNWSL